MRHICIFWGRANCAKEQNRLTYMLVASSSRKLAHAMTVVCVHMMMMAFLCARCDAMRPHTHKTHTGAPDTNTRARASLHNGIHVSCTRVCRAGCLADCAAFTDRRLRDDRTHTHTCCDCKCTRRTNERTNAIVARTASRFYAWSRPPTNPSCALNLRATTTCSCRPLTTRMWPNVHWHAGMLTLRYTFATAQKMLAHTQRKKKKKSTKTRHAHALCTRAANTAHTLRCAVCASDDDSRVAHVRRARSVELCVCAPCALCPLRAHGANYIPAHMRRQYTTQPHRPSPPSAPPPSHRAARARSRHKL